MKRYLYILIITSAILSAEPKVQVGLDTLFEEHLSLIKNKRIGLITNHTAINKNYTQAISLFKQKNHEKLLTLTAIFLPEHGIDGAEWRFNKNDKEVRKDGDISIYSLFYGQYRPPTKEILNNVDVLIFDLQDIGSRTYTFMTTLYLSMEAAAKEKIPVIILDRPNPLGGIIVDGPMLDQDVRSSVGYINVPYCHGMTAGELARFFNAEYQIQCDLTVIPMKGWNRKMTFKETELPWIPASPHIPEASTCFHYATTGILGCLKCVNTGVWFSLPFTLVAAPWIDAQKFADALNAQNYPGVHFQPHAFKPYYGRYKGEVCYGVYVMIDNPQTYLPVSTQFLLIGMLKSMYREPFEKAIIAANDQRSLITKMLGSKKAFDLLVNEKEPYIAWKLRAIDQEKRALFLVHRKKYLIKEYESS